MGENKYKSWMITVSADKENNMLPLSTHVINAFEEIGDEYAYQEEIHENSLVGNENKRHLQCYLRTKIRMRQSTLLSFLRDRINAKPDVFNITVDRMLGTREQAISYCTKEDTRAAQKQPVLSQSILDTIYEGKDLEVLSDPDKRFPWQTKILNRLYESVPNQLKAADDRTVIWITDSKGNSGKSKLVKYMCVNNDYVIKIPFGSATQLRSAIVAAGPKKLYIIDIPRTVGEDDCINNIITVVEDLKNSHVCSVMYGKYEQLLFEPPHVVIFSNHICPRSLLSKDRWEPYYIYNNELETLQENI